MGNLDPVWDHFHRNPNKGIHNDKDHHEARCMACVTKRVQTLRAAALDAQNQPGGQIAPTEDAIRASILAPLPVDHPDYHQPRRMAGKPKDLLKHLSACTNAPDDVKKEAARQLAVKENNKANKENIERTVTALAAAPSGSGSSLISVSRTSSNATLVEPLVTSVGVNLDRDGRAHQYRKVGEHTEDNDEPVAFCTAPPVDFWTPARTALFAAMLCRLLIVCNIPWFAVERPFWRHFFHTWMPGVPMPGRHELSGRILNEEAGKCEEKMRTHVRGKFATGQCDGWKDIVKKSIIAFVMNVEYLPWLVDTVDISALAKTAETLLTIVLEQIKLAQERLGLIMSAWCTDAGGECAKMRRLLVQRLPWIVVLDCWAHQVNLIVGDMLKVTGLVGVVEEALEVVKWFNNHSRALGMLRETCLQKLGKVLALILPVMTRWTAHYLCVRRLLRMEDVFGQLLVDTESRAAIAKCAGKGREAKEKAAAIIASVRAPLFWDNLRVVERHLEPLARAANATQSDCARLDVVLITTANLLHYFSSHPGLLPRAASAAIESLERRWANADQDIFILAVVFNPYIRISCFAERSPFRTPGQIRIMAERAFKRFYGTEPGREFRNALIEYLSKKGCWSDESMDLRALKAEAKADRVEVNLINVWREWSPISEGDETADLPATGPSRLASLAMRILSMVPNSAAVERIFSLFGIVHTKLRNRLEQDKVRKMVLVQWDTAREFGTGQSAKRKMFDDDGEDDEPLTFVDTATPRNDSSAQATDGGGEGSSSQARTARPEDTREARAVPSFRAMVEEITDDAETERPDPALAPTDDDRKLSNLFLYPKPGETSRFCKVLTHYWDLASRHLEREEAHQDEQYEARATAAPSGTDTESSPEDSEEMDTTV